MKRMSTFIALLSVIMLVACSDNNPVGPSNQPEIANNPDNFQFQASNLSRTTQTLTYSWTNTGASRT
jgi:outer membrane biogenesis lipoprotein LolB